VGREKGGEKRAGGEGKERRGKGWERR